MYVDLVVWGASGHALVVADVIRLTNQYNIVGFLDDINVERHQTIFAGAKVLGGREQLIRLYTAGIKHIIVAIGDCEARINLAAIACERGFQVVSVIHPRATVASCASIGSGTVIMAGAVVNAGSQLGSNVIINTGSTVDHECLIEDGVHVGPGAHLGGKVHVGKATWIGIGAVVKDRVTVGAHSLIGAGAVVLHNIPDHVVAYGVPATVQKEYKLYDA